MVHLIVLIFAGGTGVLERRNGIALVEEMYHFDGGNPSFDRRKWCIWVEEIVYLRKKTLFETVMCCLSMP
jgi:hypothetical protein